MFAPLYIMSVYVYVSEQAKNLDMGEYPRVPGSTWLR
jgi:hypothetical protein